MPSTKPAPFQKACRVPKKPFCSSGRNRPPELVKFSITNSTIMVRVVHRLRKVCRPTPMKRMPAEYSHAIPHRLASEWCARWNTGPASSAPMAPATAETPSASSARTRIGSAAPAAPRAATEA